MLRFLQLANIYITVTAGSLWMSLADILERPQNVLELLGRSLPTVVGYFVALLVRLMIQDAWHSQKTKLIIPPLLWRCTDYKNSCGSAHGVSPPGRTGKDVVLAIILLVRSAHAA